MVMLGYDNTIPVTMDEMLVFCKGVINGSKNALIVGDMPFGSYHLIYLYPFQTLLNSLN